MIRHDRPLCIGEASAGTLNLGLDPSIRERCWQIRAISEEK